MSVRRSAPVLAFGLVALIMAIAVSAWACTPQANTSLLPEAGGPGTPVFITGNSFGSSAATLAPSRITPVEIRWNSVDGPVLGTTNGPNFALSVNIPIDAPTGVGYLVAVQRNGEGGVVARVTRSFMVRATPEADRSTTAGDLWRGLDPGHSFPSMDSEAVDISRPGAALGLSLAAVGLTMLASAAVVSRGRKARASKI